ncbi:hypothetical protein HI914_00945 [Erysiphe necator]|nr:hypothetical protein HI914_00945 [Erysiphe necator]
MLAISLQLRSITISRPARKENKETMIEMKTKIGGPGRRTTKALAEVKKERENSISTEDQMYWDREPLQEIFARYEETPLHKGGDLK